MLSCERARSRDYLILSRQKHNLRLSVSLASDNARKLKQVVRATFYAGV
jgi:hypothetical protein